MNDLNIARIRELVTEAQAPCVSLFLPTHRKGVDLQQDPIRLENLLRAAEQRLDANGQNDATARQVLEPARALLTDHDFWAHQSDGLAVLTHAGGHRVLRLPLDFVERAEVGDRPYLKPLLPLLTGDGRYRVLSLTLGSVRVFEGNRDGLRELDIPDLPQRVEDVVGHDVEQKTPQQHGAGPGGRGVTHGQGTPSDDAKAEIGKFVRAVDSALHASLEGRVLPLVVAAVDHVAAVFRQVTHARRLVDQTLSGNFDHLDAAGFHERSWPLVAPQFEAEIGAVLGRVEEGLGTGRVVQRIEEVVRAAHEARVDTLLVAVDASRWGSFDANGRDVQLHDQRQHGDIDLLDRAATDTLLQGGRVHALPLEELPGDDAKALAILRW